MKSFSFLCVVVWLSLAEILWYVVGVEEEKEEEEEGREAEEALRGFISPHNSFVLHTLHNLPHS